MCIDLRQKAGQDLARKLVLDADVVIENFRPGTMKKWGLGFDELHALNPGLIYLSISGYGQTGPRAKEPGFAAIAVSARDGEMKTSPLPFHPPSRLS